MYLLQRVCKKADRDVAKVDAKTVVADQRCRIQTCLAFAILLFLIVLHMNDVDLSYASTCLKSIDACGGTFECTGVYILNVCDKYKSVSRVRKWKICFRVRSTIKQACKL